MFVSLVFACSLLAGAAAQNGCEALFDGTLMQFDGCTLAPDIPTANGIEFHYNFLNNDTELQILFRRKDDTVWIGMGFSNANGEMIGSSAVIGCGDLAAPDAYGLNAKAPADVVVGEDGLTIIGNVIQATDDGYCAILFSRALDAIGSGQTIIPSGEGQNAILVAVGSTAGLTTQHQERHRVDVNFFDGTSVGKTDNIATLTRVHVWMNWISVAWLMPIAIMCAKYKKRISPDKETGKIFGMARWFQFHRGLQVIALALSFIAWVIALSELYTGYISDVQTAHLVVGCTTMSLFILQPIISLLRPSAPKVMKGEIKPAWPNVARIRWNFYHWNAGRAVLLLGITQLGTGAAAWDASTAFWAVVFLPSAVLAILTVALETCCRAAHVAV